MKRVIAILFTALMVAGIAVADEEILIDFDQLNADFTITDPKIGDHQENQRTIMDFSIAAGSSFTDDEKALMKTSLAIKNWEVRLSSSSRTIFNQEYSLAKQARVREDAPETHFPGKYVMGIRIHFPQEMYNGWATIKPPFEIPAYQDKTTVGGDGSLTVADEDRGKGDMYDNYGVVKNVGVLKSLSVNVHGLNFPHRLSVILKNQNNEEQEVILGHLQFDGWRRLQWDNPNYIIEVRNRDLRSYPLYPKTAPMVKLVGLRIYRDGMHEGDDFIGYVKDISVVFDKAQILTERDIDDEQVWGIIQKREEARRTAEMRRLGNIQVLRYLETQKMHHEDQE
ncbi:MAG: flagellar filament outer layer protein FlaA [Spirochaetaceae bacterium]|nr:flagellar filament outer layer protein FlaA [Spirochaetaceae bacterium]